MVYLSEVDIKEGTVFLTREGKYYTVKEYAYDNKEDVYPHIIWFTELNESENKETQSHSYTEIGWVFKWKQSEEDIVRVITYKEQVPDKIISFEKFGDF